MTFTKILTSAAAVALAATPLVASAGTKASSVSMAIPAHASAPVEGKRKASSTTIVFSLVALAAVGGGIYAAVDNDNGDTASSGI